MTYPVLSRGLHLAVQGMGVVGSREQEHPCNDRRKVGQLVDPHCSAMPRVSGCCPALLFCAEALPEQSLGTKLERAHRTSCPARHLRTVAASCGPSCTQLAPCQVTCWPVQRQLHHRFRVRDSKQVTQRSLVPLKSRAPREGDAQQNKQQRWNWQQHVDGLQKDAVLTGRAACSNVKRS